MNGWRISLFHLVFGLSFCCFSKKRGPFSFSCVVGFWFKCNHINLVQVYSGKHFSLWLKLHPLAWSNTPPPPAHLAVSTLAFTLSASFNSLQEQARLNLKWMKAELWDWQRGKLTEKESCNLLTGNSNTHQPRDGWSVWVCVVCLDLSIYPTVDLDVHSPRHNHQQWASKLTESFWRFPVGHFQDISCKYSGWKCLKKNKSLVMYSILLSCVQLRFSEQKYFTILIV